jgi:hypothetical protein
MSAAMNTHATLEELLEVMISMQSVPRLHSEDHQEKLASRESEVGVGSHQCRFLSCIVRHCYQASTSEDIENFMCAVVIMIYTACRFVKTL